MELRAARIGAGSAYLGTAEWQAACIGAESAYLRTTEWQAARIGAESAYLKTTGPQAVHIGAGLASREMMVGQVVQQVVQQVVHIAAELALLGKMEGLVVYVGAGSVRRGSGGPQVRKLQTQLFGQQQQAGERHMDA